MCSRFTLWHSTQKRIKQSKCTEHVKWFYGWLPKRLKYALGPKAILRVFTCSASGIHTQIRAACLFAFGAAGVGPVLSHNHSPRIDVYNIIWQKMLLPHPFRFLGACLLVYNRRLGVCMCMYVYGCGAPWRTNGLCCGLARSQLLQSIRSPFSNGLAHTGSRPRSRLS